MLRLYFAVTVICYDKWHPAVFQRNSIFQRNSSHYELDIHIHTSGRFATRTSLCSEWPAHTRSTHFTPCFRLSDVRLWCSFELIFLLKSHFYTQLAPYQISSCASAEIISINILKPCKACFLNGRADSRICHQITILYSREFILIKMRNILVAVDRSPVSTHTHTHTHTRTHTRAHTHTYTQTHIHKDTQTQRHTNTRARVHAHAHYTHIHTHLHTHTHTYSHTHMHTRTHSHMHAKTHTHIHTHTLAWKQILHTCKTLAVEYIFVSKLNLTCNCRQQCLQEFSCVWNCSGLATLRGVFPPEHLEDRRCCAPASYCSLGMCAWMCLHIGVHVFGKATGHTIYCV